MNKILKVLNIIGYITLAVVIFLWIQIGVSSQSPCSVWSSHQSECSSDMLHVLGK
jgi:hypothetical protein